MAVQWPCHPRRRCLLLLLALSALSLARLNGELVSEGLDYAGVLHGQSYSEEVLDKIQETWPEDLPRYLDYRYCLTKVKKQIGGSCHSYADDVLMEAQYCLARGGSSKYDRRQAFDINDFWACKNYGGLFKLAQSDVPGPDMPWWSAIHGSFPLADYEFFQSEARAANCSAAWDAHQGTNRTWLEENGYDVSQCGCRRSRNDYYMQPFPNDIGPGLGERKYSELQLFPSLVSTEEDTLRNRWPFQAYRWNGGVTGGVAEGTCNARNAGSCRFMSRDECSAFAASRGTEVKAPMKASPIGCYLYKNEGVYFNDGSKLQTMNCSASRKCICACENTLDPTYNPPKNQRICKQTPMAVDDAWQNEVWFARLLRTYGPSRVMTYVTGFTSGTTDKPVDVCLKKTFKSNGHNYAVVGYNATDLKNAYWIVADTMLGYVGDAKRAYQSGKQEKDLGYTFLKMFNFCGNDASYRHGTYGIAWHAKFDTLCPVERDVRSTKLGGIACDYNNVDICFTDDNHKVFYY